jgi:CotH kinase protein
MSTQEQQALDSLYALDNVVTIKITMPQADWDALRTEEPAGGECNFNWKGGERYTWHEATSVEISGTSFPAATTFTQVGLKKKSFCGSISSEKPCVDIDFGKFNDANVPVIHGLIGSHYLTLNNSIQDPSYIHQTLGYKLFAMAGLPYSRCNFAQVFVNGALIGQGFGGVNSPGIFVNVEPIMKPYIKRNFNGNTNGNLYEIAHLDDFVSARLPFITVEDLSKFDNKADLSLADDQIAAHGVAGASQMLDLDQFIKHYAMEFFLKSWDGYTNNTNNTYIYNDVDAVAAPGVNDVKFKMIPWGIDQILQPILPVIFKMTPSGLIAQLVRNDAARYAQLIDQIQSYRDTVFSPENQQTVLKPLIDQMEALVVGFGVPNAVSEIAGVRQQLQLAASAHGGITAVARTPNHLDVFWVGLDGSVGSNWWDVGANNGNWNAAFQIAPAKSAAGAVTAVARTPNHLDVFWVGVDGSVGSNWWDVGANNGAWNTPFEIAPAGSAQGAVTVVARTPNHLDVFWVGVDGSVGSNWWDVGANNGRWNTPFEIPPGRAAQGAVTVVARTPNHLDVFWVGLDGSVGSNWWDAGANNGAWNTPFERFGP